MKLALQSIRPVAVASTQVISDFAAVSLIRKEIGFHGFLELYDIAASECRRANEEGILETARCVKVEVTLRKDGWRTNWFLLRCKSAKILKS